MIRLTPSSTLRRIHDIAPRPRGPVAGHPPPRRVRISVPCRSAGLPDVTYSRPADADVPAPPPHFLLLVTQHPPPHQSFSPLIFLWRGTPSRCFWSPIDAPACTFTLEPSSSAQGAEQRLVQFVYSSKIIENLQRAWIFASHVSAIAASCEYRTGELTRITVRLDLRDRKMPLAVRPPSRQSGFRCAGLYTVRACYRIGVLTAMRA